MLNFDPFYLRRALDAAMPNISASILACRVFNSKPNLPDVVAVATGLV